MAKPAAKPLTVYYDASCPMCASEMRVLREAAGADGLELIDCSSPRFDPSVCAAEGVTREAMMTKLHARDASGRWLVALDAYEAVYRAAGYGRIARLWGSRLLRPVLDPVYAVIARHRNSISRLGVHSIIGRMLRR